MESLETPKLVHPPKCGLNGGARHTVHLNWRETLQLPSFWTTGQPSIPTVLYLCIRAFALERSPGQVRERW